MKLLSKNIGIIAFLGAYKKHKQIFDKIWVKTTYIRNIEDLDKVDALVIPGSEIVPLSFSIEELLPEIRKRLRDKMPIMLTGEACLLLNEDHKTYLAHKNLRIEKIQHNDFDDETLIYDTDLFFEKFDTKPFNATFIRSPKIQKKPIWFKNLALLNEWEDHVCIENDCILACTFYPELWDDTRVHEYFVTKI